jgi:hypothetical protein
MGNRIGNKASKTKGKKKFPRNSECPQDGSDYLLIYAINFTTIENKIF